MEHDPDFRLPPEKPNQFNFNTLVGVIALATLGWLATKTAANNDSLTKIETTLPYMTQSVTDLKSQIAQLVTRAEVESRFSELAAKNALLDARLMKLEYEKRKPDQP
jgi:hypothetical protein